MRKSAFVAGLLIAAVFFVAAGSLSAHAESQNNQQPTTTQIAQSAPVPTPAPTPKVVEVQAGDYLAKIAEENQTTYPRLYDANENIKDPNVIYPGDKLRVPLPDEQIPSRAPVVAATPAPVPQQQAAVVQPRVVQQAAPNFAVGDGSVWDRLAQCESGGNWAINTGNGFYGGLQFTLSSWHGVGGSGYPNEASREEQISRAQMLQARQGWGAWPACSAKLGIR